MKTKNVRVLWWKTSEGKFVAHNDRALLDAPTKALVHDFLKFHMLAQPFDRKTLDDVEVFKIVETPLPFEPIHEWMTWTMQGNEINH